MINKIAKSVEEACQHDSSGHDWWHIYRVWNLAKLMSKKEAVDLHLVELAALLHDLDDWKLSDKNQENLPNARRLLAENRVSKDTTEKVVVIINEV